MTVVELLQAKGVTLVEGTEPFRNAQEATLLRKTDLDEVYHLEDGGYLDFPLGVPYALQVTESDLEEGFEFVLGKGAHAVLAVIGTLAKLYLEDKKGQ